MLFSEFTTGALFGIGLYSSGVYSSSIIKAQFDFSNNAMITTMMAASAVSSIVMDAMDRFGVLKKKHSPPSNLGFFAYDGNMLGAFMLGAGMAVTGSCPGTTFVQAGTGSLPGLLVMLGGLLGAIAFVKLQDRLAQRKTEVDKAEAQVTNAQNSPPLENTSKTPLDIATALKIPPMALLLIWTPLCLMIVQLAFAKDHSLRGSIPPGLVPPAYGGLMIGLAQLATVFLTKHAIGTSSSFEDVARWLDSKFTRSNDKAHRTLLTGPVVFVAGIVCAAALLKQTFHPKTSPTSLGDLSLSMALQSLLGGFTMVLGARIARGCTSGHGISGLSKFSLPSLVSTAAMFGAGIATTAILRR